ncbi:hypothetical protein JL09_g5690 [Pichia kudriavzevii]|uniref:Uncharacterized protein n=1 Tax=Pichia kudriavzevii TaxID=4909 RepID=A0A099NRG6_PICKU|nr:hypothetical protein JL09_g5690 [Pichia kudriavzevii]
MEYFKENVKVLNHVEGVIPYDYVMK